MTPRRDQPQVRRDRRLRRGRAVPRHAGQALLQRHVRAPRLRRRRAPGAGDPDRRRGARGRRCRVPEEVPRQDGRRGGGEGRTVLFVSHNMNAVERLCGRVICLSYGSIIADSKDVEAAISGYLNASVNPDSRTWTAHPSKKWSDYFEPLSINASIGGGQQIFSDIPKDTPFRITVGAMIESLDPALTVGFDVYNDQGILVFRTYQTDLEQEKWPILRTGLNTLSVEFPAHFLNEGTYSFG